MGSCAGSGVRVMADTRQQYHGFEARKLRNRMGIVRHQNMFYWRMSGRAWFYFLRKKPKNGGRVWFVFDHPMSYEKRR